MPPKELPRAFDHYTDPERGYRGKQVATANTESPAKGSNTQEAPKDEAEGSQQTKKDPCTFTATITQKTDGPVYKDGVKQIKLDVKRVKKDRAAAAKDE